MKTVSSRFLALLLIAAFVNLTSAQKLVSDKELPNFHQISPVFYRGAQPTENGVKELAALGVKTIIDLRGADEMAKHEAMWAQKANVKFINVPLSNWFEPRNAQIDKVLAEVSRPENQPVFVHCKRGADRTGTIVAVYRIEHDGWTAKQANAEAKSFGFGWWQFWMKDYIEDYYEDRIAGK